MRGDDRKQGDMFSYITPEARVPQDHPLRPIRVMTDRVLTELSPQFEKIYSRVGRPSIPPEMLLRALLLQVRQRGLCVRSTFQGISKVCRLRRGQDRNCSRARRRRFDF